MALSSGTRLGSYEILALAGKGGMGEVYKARDTRLDRIVAIKIAHENFSERFEREARVAAALNHPHVGQLYDVGPNYLVMEYVEGKILSGPLPVPEVLRLAAQICDALDVAHTRGIVHRDLKPENILVTKSKEIKLLDFGLAKITEHPVANGSDWAGTQSFTKQGSIIGTLHYMSPEQLQGREVDSRSDIFSFGAVLYEMLTGRRAFDAATPADLVVAILASEPSSLSSLDPLPPPAFERILRRCLAKDPEARWQSARDLGAALACLPEGLIPEVPQQRTWLPRPMVWGLLLFFAVLATAFGLYTLRGPPEARRIIRLSLPTPPGSEFRMPVISPDGSQIVYSSGDTRTGQVWVRSFSSFEPQLIESANPGSVPFWSPDSKQIALVVEGKLARFNLAAQSHQTICDLPGNPGVITGSWNSAGTIIFSNKDGISRVPAAGGEPIPVTRVDHSRGELGHFMPYFLPDGRHFLFLFLNQLRNASAIEEGSIDLQPIKRVMANPIGPFFLIGKDLIFARGSTLMAQPFDWKTARLTGNLLSLQERAYSASPEHVYSGGGSFTPFASFAVSPDVLAYFPERLSQTELVWFDRQGKRISSVGSMAQYTNPALSPNQKLIAVGINDPLSRTRDLWVLDASGGDMRLTSDLGDDFNPVWSPDGKWIAFASDRKGVRDLFVQPAALDGTDELMLASSSQKSFEGWSPDGKLLIYNDNTSRIMAVPFRGEHKPFPIVEGAGTYDQGAISPDGQWIAYRSHELGHVEVFLQSFPVGGTRWQLSTNGGGEPSWRRDGKELYFARDHEVFAVELKVTAGGVEHSAPKLLFSAPLAVVIGRNRYVPAADGQRFLVVTQPAAAESAHVILNWRANLKD